MRTAFIDTFEKKKSIVQDFVFNVYLNCVPQPTQEISWLQRNEKKERWFLNGTQVMLMRDMHTVRTQSTVLSARIAFNGILCSIFWIWTIISIFLFFIYLFILFFFLSVRMNETSTQMQLPIAYCLLVFYRFTIGEWIVIDR